MPVRRFDLLRAGQSSGMTDAERENAQPDARVGSAAYCAAKGGLGLLTRTAAIELAAHGITVNAVASG